MSPTESLWTRGSTPLRLHHYGTASVSERSLPAKRTCSDGRGTDVTRLVELGILRVGAPEPALDLVVDLIDGRQSHADRHSAAAHTRRGLEATNWPLVREPQPEVDAPLGGRLHRRERPPRR